jgi:Leucine-rich repeat (LRR) protein
MKALEVLNIADTRVSTLRPLQNVRTLTELDCSSTKISAASFDYLTSHNRLKFLRGRNLDVEQKDLDAFSASFVKRFPECDVILTHK